LLLFWRCVVCWLLRHCELGRGVCCLGVRFVMLRSLKRTLCLLGSVYAMFML
jgi:hypothetical protein